MRGRRWWPMFQRRDRLDAWRLVGPYEEHRTWRVVDNESSGVPDALWPESGVVAVACHDEHVNPAGHRADDLAFDASTPAEQLSIRVAETRGGVSEQFRRFVIRHVVVAAGRLPPREAAPEQSDGGRIGRVGHVRGRDVEQGESRIGGKVLDGSVDAPLPGSLDHPDHNAHERY